MKTIAIQPVAVLSKPRPRRLAGRIRLAFATLLERHIASPLLRGIAAGVERALVVCCAGRTRDCCTIRVAVPMPIAHSLLMAFGFMPLFRRFPVHRRPALVRMPPVHAQPRGYRSPSMRLPGWSTCPLCTSTLYVAVGCVALAAYAWSMSPDGAYARMVDASDAGDRVHARVVRIGVVMGVAALWTAAFCATESWLLLRVTVIGSRSGVASP